jgi:PAS domain S-box-containing protein
MTVIAESGIRKWQGQDFEPQWLRAVVEEGDAGFLIERDEDIAYVNQAYVRMLGYESPDQLRGHHLTAVVAEEDAARLLAFTGMRQRGEPAPRMYEFSARRRDRSVVRLQASVSASRVDGEFVITTMVLPCEDSAASRPASGLDDTAASRLSPREREVLGMILAGKRTKEIAFDLDVSPKTVSTHRFRLLQKLNLTSNRDLFQYAVTHRLLDWS